MTNRSWRSRTKQDLIIEVWEHLDCESVGARELEQIQEALHEKFGKGAGESPASIARTVAEEGAVLRHPEVFDCDVKWRETFLNERSRFGEMKFSNLTQAIQSFARLEEKRKELKALGPLREVVSEARQNLLLTSRSNIVSEAERAQAKEILQWLTVWLQAPELFPDWLDLRRRSPDFKKKFGEQ